MLRSGNHKRSGLARHFTRAHSKVHKHKQQELSITYASPMSGSDTGSKTTYHEPARSYYLWCSPVLRSGNTNTVAVRATSLAPFTLPSATLGSIAASYWIGPSTWGLNSNCKHFEFSIPGRGCVWKRAQTADNTPPPPFTQAKHTSRAAPATQASPATQHVSFTLHARTHRHTHTHRRAHTYQDIGPLLLHLLHRLVHLGHLQGVCMKECS